MLGAKCFFGAKGNIIFFKGNILWQIFYKKKHLKKVS
jgi:hypothetical protein